MSATPVRAQDYPTRPIRILVPYAAGGVVTVPSTVAELDARIKCEAAVYKAIIEKANIHID
jgi:hypothetical protein